MCACVCVCVRVCAYIGEGPFVDFDLGSVEVQLGGGGSAGGFIANQSALIDQPAVEYRTPRTGVEGWEKPSKTKTLPPHLRARLCVSV